MELNLPTTAAADDETNHTYDSLIQMSISGRFTDEFFLHVIACSDDESQGRCSTSVESDFSVSSYGALDLITSDDEESVDTAFEMEIANGVEDELEVFKFSELMFDDQEMTDELRTAFQGPISPASPGRVTPDVDVKDASIQAEIKAANESSSCDVPYTDLMFDSQDLTDQVLEALQGSTEEFMDIPTTVEVPGACEGDQSDFETLLNFIEA